MFKLNFQPSCRRANCFDVLCSFHHTSFGYEKGNFQSTKAKLTFVVCVLFMKKWSPETVSELCKAGAVNEAGKQTGEWVSEWGGRGSSGKMARLGSVAILPSVSQPEQLHCDHTHYTFRDSRLVKGRVSGDWRRVAVAVCGGVCHRGCEGEWRQYLDGNKGRNPWLWKLS